MDAFLTFYFSSISIFRTMLTQFVIVAGYMMSPNNMLSEIVGEPVSIITLMLGSGIIVYITVALIKFFSNFF